MVSLSVAYIQVNERVCRSVPVPVVAAPVAVPVKAKPNKFEKLASLLALKAQKKAGKFGGGLEHGGFEPVHAAPAHAIFRRDAEADEIEAGPNDKKLNAKEAYVLHKKSLEALKQQVSH